MSKGTYPKRDEHNKISRADLKEARRIAGRIREKYALAIEKTDPCGDREYPCLKDAGVTDEQFLALILDISLDKLEEERQGVLEWFDLPSLIEKEEGDDEDSAETTDA